MGYVNGRWVWREESGLGREEEEGKKKKEKKKEKRWFGRGESHWQSLELARKRQDIENGAHHMNIFTKMPPSLCFHNLKTPKMCFQFP